MGGTIGVGFQFQNLGLQRDRFEQFIKALTGLSRHFDILHFTGHLFDDDFVLQQIRADLIRVRFRLIHLVDGHDHRHVSRFGVVDGLNRLRHHRVVSCHNQNHDISHLRTTGPHGRKRRVARGIKERQNRAAICGYLIGTDVLSDPACFAGHNPRVADRIQKRRFAVVNVAHDRDDRRTAFQIFGLVFFGVDHVFDVCVRHTDNVVTELVDDQFSGIRVNGLRLRCHDAVGHQRLHNVCDLFGHPVGKLADHDGLGQLHVADDLFTLNGLAHGLLAGAFLLTLHLRHGPLTATFATTQRLIQGQLAGATAIIGLALTALVTVVLFLAGRRRRGRRTATLCGGDSRIGNRGSSGLRCGLGFTLLALFLFLLGLHGLFAFTLFALFGFLLGTTLGAFLGTGLFFGRTFCSVFSLTGLGRLQCFHAAFKFGVRNTGGPLGRITPHLRLRTRSSTRLCRTRLGHDNALALRFNDDTLGAAMAEALLHLSGPCNPKWFLTVLIAHVA